LVPGLADSISNTILDPLVSLGEALLQIHTRSPPEHLLKSRVIRVATPNALWTVYVCLLDLDSRSIGDEVGEPVDRDESILANVQRLRIGGMSEAINAFAAVVDVTE
jgi:hypothetical protein